jgi:hypothetical protein
MDESFVGIFQQLIALSVRKRIFGRTRAGRIVLK